MPTYEYLCLKCNKSFDVFQGIKEELLKRCPKCRGKVRRQIGSGAGIIFKGSGFYATDYKSSSPGNVSGPKAQQKKESGKDKSDKPKK